MGQYSHLLAVVLALADVPFLASAHPIVKSSLLERARNNDSDDDKEEERDTTPGVAVITGTAIGAGLAFLIFCFVVFWVYKRNTNPKKQQQQQRKKIGDAEMGDTQREQQRREPQRGEPEQRKPEQRAPERSASESTTCSSSTTDSGVVTKDQNKEKKEKSSQQQQQQQQQRRLRNTPRQNSPHRFAAELPASDEPRRPPMARIRGFDLVLPPLMPPPTRPFTRPLPPTPPPSHPLPAPPTHARPPPPKNYPNHPLPPLPTPQRPPRPDTPQLPPTRVRRPSRQNLTTAAVTPPRLTPLNTKDVRITRPRAGTGASSGISPKTIVMPVQQQQHHLLPLQLVQQQQQQLQMQQQMQQQQQQQRQLQQLRATSQRRPQAPQRQQYQQYQDHYLRQHHHNHNRDQSQHTLIPSPDSGWSLSTFSTGMQDHHAAAAAQLDRFPVSPESPSGARGTVYISFEERVPAQWTRKSSIWSDRNSQQWPAPLSMTRQLTTNGRHINAGGDSLGR